MNTIKIKSTTLQTPSAWDELTQNQFIDVVKNKMEGKNFEISTFNFPLINRLSPVQKYHLQNTFAFLDQKPNISRLLVQSFSVQGVDYVGYQAGFSNTTWEEFMYADQYFMNNKFFHAIAVLYREKKENHDGQSDVRIPFSIYGTEKRLANIQNLDKSIVAAIALNYKALREINIADKYPHIFTSSPLERAGVRHLSDELGEAAFSWVTVHRNILSEHFFEEEKFLKSNVHAVLHRMNALVAENRKSKK